MCRGIIFLTMLPQSNSPLPNYVSALANDNLKLRLGARKYSNCMKTLHQASTSCYCSRELKLNLEMGYCTISLI